MARRARTRSVRVRRCEGTLNDALTDPLVTTHAVVPLHAPVQPRNAAPAKGVAVSVTARENVPLQLPGQSIPDGLLVTVPEPLTVTETDCKAVR